jgi:neopullulanase
MYAAIPTPDWVKDAIFYQIFPDRFAKSHRVSKPNNLEDWDAPPTIHGFKGGDLLGVCEKLDYLQELGINAIYFTPIFQSACNHRYHTHDYFQVDPLLGGNPAFREFLEAAHRRGMRIVLDGVFNHASRGFFQFNHILECGPASPYLDWFDIRGFPLNAYEGEPNYRCWVNLPALPEFNTQNPQVRDFIFGVARYWLEQGIDGWRLDVPFCIEDDEFWREFRRVVKIVNSEAYIVGEVPWEAQRWLQGDQFDAVMNYQFTQACLGFFGGEGIDYAMEENMMGLPRTKVLDASSFAQRAEALLKLYPQEIALAQLNLLDSHDMPRFSSLVGYDKTALKLAVLFQMTYPGAPCVYYGDEIGLRNGPRRIPEDCRYAFPWEESCWDKDLLKTFKEYIALRKAHSALRRGEFIPLYAEGQLFAYLRRLGEESVVVVLNNGNDRASLDIPVDAHLPEGGRWQDQLADGEATVSKGRFCGSTLAPRSGAVFC